MTATTTAPAPEAEATTAADEAAPKGTDLANGTGSTAPDGGDHPNHTDKVKKLLKRGGYTERAELTEYQAAALEALPANAAKAKVEQAMESKGQAAAAPAAPASRSRNTGPRGTTSAYKEADAKKLKGEGGYLVWAVVGEDDLLYLGSIKGSDRDAMYPAARKAYEKADRMASHPEPDDVTFVSVRPNQIRETRMVKDDAGAADDS